MRFLRILGWAIFLGASWTWCIGMYLPALLVRDYGIWAFVVFAVPNVVGAAAMGWVLPDGEASRRFVNEHNVACRWFSIITVAFHLLFLAWVVSIYWMPWAVLAGVVGAAGVFWWCEGRVAAAIAWGMSFAVAAILIFSRRLPNIDLSPLMQNRQDLFWLGLACAFGFIFCPYLDLTFHQARQATTPSDGRITFGWGFGLFFGSMIFFTLSYSKIVDSDYPDWPFYAYHYLGSLLVLHFLVQAVLKLVLHGRAGFNGPGRVIFAAFLICAAAAWCSSRSMSWPQFVYQRLGLFEIIYRCFLVFYGLVFPAYLWICVIRRCSIRNWVAAVAIATPFFGLGFIGGTMVWIFPGLLAVLLAGLLPISRARTVPSEPSPS